MIFNFYTINSTMHKFELDENTKTLEYSSNFNQNKFKNYYEVQISDMDLIENKNFFLIFESENPEFIVSILKESKNKGIQNYSIVLDLKSHSGSGNIMMAMSDTFFNSKFNFFKETGVLKFIIRNTDEYTKKLDYKIKIQMQRKVDLDLGKIYSTRIDRDIKELSANLSYNGTLLKNLKKLRFQITSVQQKTNYSLGAELTYLSNTYKLNNIFKKSLGGILKSPLLPICKSTLCIYQLKITPKSVKVFNLESFLIEEIETLDIRHFEEYYDKTYTDNIKTYYKLPYIPEMEKINLSISLIPVSGDSTLYVNARTKPLDVETSDWKERGKLAKRITVKWEELVRMNAEKSDLFIVVEMSQASEFLLKIDGHEEGFRGRLSAGITESGFVEFEEISQYLYLFNVYETQDIDFRVILNIISGDADVYVKKCEKIKGCNVSAGDIKEGKLIKIENSQNVKEIRHKFTCEKDKRHHDTSCEYLIAVRGKENQGTHYEISLNESNLHRLMISGHSIPLQILPREKTYLKFSVPNNKKGSEFFLSVENIWGSFNLYLDKENLYPTAEENILYKSFHSLKAGLLDSLQTIPLNHKTLKTAVVGSFFVTIESTTSSSLNIKLFEKKVTDKKNGEKNISFHSLTAGKQTRGEISNENEIQYFTIRIALDESQTENTHVNLTPLKGDFNIFANHNGQLPTKDNNQFYSEDHNLTLPIKLNDKKVEEYIIGVQLSENTKTSDTNYQFILTFFYPNKPLKLNPGILSKEKIKSKNAYYIEIHKEMENLLIIKTINDGYQVKLCANFSSSEDLTKSGCDYKADDKKVSLYISGKQIREKCNFDKNPKCYLLIKIEGPIDHMFNLGFTFNSHPFHLIKGEMITGPAPTSPGNSLYFIYHPDPNENFGVYFNSKGKKLDVYSKLIDSKEIDDDVKGSFPNGISGDMEGVVKDGYVTTVFYTKSELKKFGDSAEVLITVKYNSNIRKEEDLVFCADHPFLIQTFTDSRELLRTHSFTQQVQAQDWNYFHFYNNGNSESIRVYVNSSDGTKIRVILSEGIKGRPPFTTKGIIEKTDIGVVFLEINQKNFSKGKKRKSKKKLLKGNYTIAIQSNKETKLNLFWNNISNLNYIELTPNKPSQMYLEKDKNFYFSFYAKDPEDSTKEKGKIVIYIKTNIQAKVWLLKSKTNEMKTPDSTNNTWSTSIPVLGGMSTIEIYPDDPDYCTDCLYIGHIEASTFGHLYVLADIEHEHMPIKIVIGNSFPCYLEPDESKIYKIYNPDSKLLDFTISMLSGFVDVYVSDDPKISEKNFKDKYEMEANLDVHKFFSVNPESGYDIHRGELFYLLVKNSKDNDAGLTINVDKNSMDSAIIPGIKKFVRLAENEETNFFYVPKEDEDLFEIELEVREVLDPVFIDSAVDGIENYLKVYHVNESLDKYELEYKGKFVHENRLRVEFDLKDNTKGKFFITIVNKVQAPVLFVVNMISGNYKLIHLNERIVDIVKPGESRIYEAFGRKSKYLFVDLKMCLGDVDAFFYEDNLLKMDKKDNSKYKTIKDTNSFTHYLKLTKNKIFFKLKNKQEVDAIFNLSAYNERDLTKDSYTEIKLKNKGKVSIDTESKNIQFDELDITSNYDKHFFHRITYQVYITTNFKQMRYAKNCGKYLIEKNFKDDDLKSFKKVINYNTEKPQENPKKFNIKYTSLEAQKKYYGILVAKIELFPKDLGYLTPVRINYAFYDEFIIHTSKYEIPSIFIVGISICFGFMGFLVIIVKGYVFSDVRRMSGVEKLRNLSMLDEGAFGKAIIESMEDGDYKDMREDEEVEGEQEGEEGAVIEMEVRGDDK